MVIGIAAGHSETGNEIFRAREHAHCRKVEPILAAMLRAAGYKVFAICEVDKNSLVYSLPNNDALQKKVSIFNQAEVDYAVEIHLNGGGGNYGCCLYHHSSGEGHALANQLSMAGTQMFPWPQRGGLTPEQLGRTSLHFLSATSMPAVITEMGFLDNRDHAAVLEPTQGIIAHAHALFNGLDSFIRSRL